MALLITKPTEYSPSINATYFNIKSVIIRKTGVCNVMVEGFSSKADRLAGSSPIVKKGIVVTYNIASATPTWDELYTLIKADPYFTGATDDV
jgi:hypothetical protein